MVIDRERGAKHAVAQRTGLDTWCKAIGSIFIVLSISAVGQYWAHRVRALLCCVLSEGVWRVCPHDARQGGDDLYLSLCLLPAKEHHFPPKLARASILVGGWWIPQREGGGDNIIVVYCGPLIEQLLVLCLPGHSMFWYGSYWIGFPSPSSRISYSSSNLLLLAHPPLHVVVLVLVVLLVAFQFQLNTTTIIYCCPVAEVVVLVLFLLLRVEVLNRCRGGADVEVQKDASAGAGAGAGTEVQIKVLR
jgi:hypothetical protein